MEVIGSFSGEIAHWWKAMQFLSVAQSRFDFSPITSKKYSLNDINEAVERMANFEDTKSIIIF